MASKEGGRGWERYNFHGYSGGSRLSYYGGHRFNKSEVTMSSWHISRGLAVIEIWDIIFLSSVNSQFTAIDLDESDESEKNWVLLCESYE